MFDRPTEEEQDEDLAREQITKLERKYAHRIKKILWSMKRSLKDAGFKTSSLSEIPGEYASMWQFVTYVKGTWREMDDDDVDINMGPAISEECDGEKNGVNFVCHIGTVGGRILGGLTPFNYTKDVWVPRNDEEAVERRFELLASADPSSLVDIVKRHAERAKR